MRAFIATAGVLFALIFVAHILRLVLEGPGPLRDPIFILTSVASIGVSAWSFYLLTRPRVKLD